MNKPNWIGRVKLPDGRAATLGRDGIWRCDDEFLRLCLNSNHNPHKVRGVDAILPFGRGAITNAALDLNATAEFSEELPPLAPGEIS